MSAQIRKERKDYYEILEKTQRGSLDITLWLDWYLTCLRDAISEAKHLQESVIYKAQFWDAVAGFALNERQKKVLNKILDGLEGKLTSSKWAALAKCSQDTATRDINELIEKEILEKEAAGGRSTSYSIKTDKHCG
jgi:Fic family protein